jgi:hypothetical protein
MAENGTLIDATRATIQDTWDALKEGLALDGTYALAVHSKAAADAFGVDSVVTRDVIHHQRRRNN